MKVSIVAVLRTALLTLTFALPTTACNQSDERVSKSVSPPIGDTSEAHDQHPRVKSHDAHAEHAPAPLLQEGQRWASDEPLRAAMTRIREAVESNEPAYWQRKLQAADAEALAVAVEQNIAYMIANCRLAPEPDAALHALIGRMMNAAVALRKDPGADAGLPQLAAVLQEYSTTFDHPGWPAPDQAH